MKSALPGIKEKLIIDDPIILISISTGLSLINVTWRQILPIKEKQPYFDLAFSLSHQYNLKYLLSDSRIYPFIDLEEQSWMANYFFLNKNFGKIKRIARVNDGHSHELLDAISLREKVKATFAPSHELIFEIFDDPNTALYWLMNERRILELSGSDF